MITKVHTSILNIHSLVGEKDALKWLSESQKAAVSSALPIKTPSKPTATTTSTKRKTTVAAAAAASASTSGEEPVAGGSGSGGQGAAGEAEREFFETLKANYIHLMEMDELLREKLFILQVFLNNTLGSNDQKTKINL
jgi:hypothetical protein